MSVFEMIAFVQVYIHVAKGVQVQIDPARIVVNVRQEFLLERAFRLAQANLQTISLKFI